PSLSINADLAGLAATPQRVGRMRIGTPSKWLDTADVDMGHVPLDPTHIDIQKSIQPLHTWTGGLAAAVAVAAFEGVVAVVAAVGARPGGGIGLVGERHPVPGPLTLAAAKAPHSPTVAAAARPGLVQHDPGFPGLADELVECEAAPADPPVVAAVSAAAIRGAAVAWVAVHLG
ncbi:hypothetical protein Vretimale_4890, partial [Volvox reticuliferus]